VRSDARRKRPEKEINFGTFIYGDRDLSLNRTEIANVTVDILPPIAFPTDHGVKCTPGV